MFDHLLRQLKDRWLAPFSRLLGARVSPFSISLLAFVAGVGAALAAYRGQNTTALVAWLINRTLDGLDGTHARVHNSQSDVGGYLDIMFDFIVRCHPVGARGGIASTSAIRRYRVFAVDVFCQRCIANVSRRYSRTARAWRWRTGRTHDDHNAAGAHCRR